MDRVKMLEADNAGKIHADSPLDQRSQSRLPATEADCAAKTDLKAACQDFFSIQQLKFAVIINRVCNKASRRNRINMVEP